MRIKYLGLLLIWLCFSAYAATNSPLPMLQNTSDQLIASLKQNKATLKTNPQVVYNIVQQILLPHVDAAGMARSVVGRDMWTQATPTQQAQFTKEFTDLLIHTYSSALASYQNETVQFLPIRGGVTGSRVQVNSQIIRQNGPAVSVNYRLALVGQQWKVYDFSVDGISMLESYRSQFADEIAQGATMDKLIAELKQHNAQS